MSTHKKKKKSPVRAIEETTQTKQVYIFSNLALFKIENAEGLDKK